MRNYAISKAHMKYYTIFILLFTILSGYLLPAHAASEPSLQCVVLLHGLARTSSSMSTMAQRLKENGYTVVNVDYPSRQKRIEELAGPAVLSRGIAAALKRAFRRKAA